MSNVLQTVIVGGASLRQLMRTTGLRTDPQSPVVIVGCGPRFPEVSGLDWAAGCDDLLPGDHPPFHDLRDLVAALTSASDLLSVAGDAASVETLHDL